MTSSGIALAIRGLGFTAAGRPIVAGIDLDLAAASLVALIGPSGSGKTTLLRCLAGLQDCSTGSIAARIDGSWYAIDRDSRHAWHAHIGLVPQQDHLPGDLTPGAVLRQACQHAGLPRAAQRERIAESLQAVGLSWQRQPRTAEVSGGQQRRLSIARALIRRPGLLFLDEPTSGLDIATAHEIMDLLGTLARSGTTVICTSHLPSTLVLCDRVLVMARGRSGAGIRADWGRAEFQEQLAADRDGCALYRAAEQLPGTAPLPPAPATVDADPPEPDRPLLPVAHVGAVLKRSAIGLLYDRDSLLMLVLQPLLLAAIILASQSLQHGNLLRFCDFFGAVAALWLGMSGTVRDLVGERRLYVMERLSGLSPGAYLLARLLWGAAVALIGTGLLTAALVGGVILLHGEDAVLMAGLDGSAGLLARAAVFGLCGISGALLGLAVSACAGSVRAAVSAMPLLILPQMLFSRFATGRGELPRGHEDLGAWRELAAGSPFATGLDGWLEQLNAAIGLLTTSRHASWVLDGLMAGTWLVADLIGLVVVLGLELLVLVLLVVSLQRRWTRSLVAPGGGGP